jgi:hypothetical protein
MSADFWPWPPHLPSKEAEEEEGARGIALSVPKSAEKCSIYRISTVNVARALTFEIFFFVVDAGMSALLSRKGAKQFQILDCELERERPTAATAAAEAESSGGAREGARFARGDVQLVRGDDYEHVLSVFTHLGRVLSAGDTAIGYDVQFSSALDGLGDEWPQDDDIESPPLSNLEGSNSINGQPSRPAIAFANVVLPVPGGPKSKTVAGAFTPTLSAVVGSAKGATTRPSIIFFSACIPATRSHRSGDKISPPY